MRSIVWVFALTGYCVGSTAPALGQERVQPMPIESVPAPLPSAVAYAGVAHDSSSCESCAACGHDSCRCKRRCEAARYRSDIPKGHCEAICVGLQKVGDMTIDVPYSFYEWCKKIKNTVLDRGTCRNRCCSN